MALPVLIGVFVFLVLAIVLFSALRGSGSRSIFDYYLKARDSGLSWSEARQLRKAGLDSGAADANALLWSARDLDAAISLLVALLGETGRDRTRDGIAFIDKLYALRKQIEFEQPRLKYGIKSSSHISQGQRVRVLVHNIGVYNATVIDNNQRYLVISYPSGQRLPQGWVWRGKKVSIYFWRAEDAGYVFDSYVMDDLRIRNIPVLHISHSESLLRTQKRGSIRAKVRLPAYVYLLRRLEGAYEKPEKAPGLRAVVQDISEDGAAVAIGGKAVIGLMVKLQFALDGRHVVMSGTVRSIDYDRDKNRSVLHVEAVSPSPRTRNAIRAYVYAMKADDLPTTRGSL